MGEGIFYQEGYFYNTNTNQCFKSFYNDTDIFSKCSTFFDGKAFVQLQSWEFSRLTTSDLENEASQKLWKENRQKFSGDTFSFAKPGECVFQYENNFYDYDFNINLFIDLFMCTLFMFFLDYVPEKHFQGKKLRIFRAMALIPVI